jgi:hypothetical protein
VGWKARRASEVNEHWGLVRGSVGDKRHLQLRAKTINQTSQASFGSSSGSVVGSPRQQKARRPTSSIFTEQQADNITSFISVRQQSASSGTSMKQSQQSIKGSDIHLVPEIKVDTNFMFGEEDFFVGSKARRASEVNGRWGLVRGSVGDKSHFRQRAKTICQASQFPSAGSSSGIDVESPRQQRARRPTSSIFTENHSNNITSFIRQQSQTSGTPTKNSQSSIDGLEIDLVPEIKVDTNFMFGEEGLFVGSKARRASEVIGRWGLVRGSVGDKSHFRQRAKTICQASQFPSGSSSGIDVGSPRQQRARRPSSSIFTGHHSDNITSFIRQQSQTSMKQSQSAIEEAPTQHSILDQSYLRSNDSMGG